MTSKLLLSASAAFLVWACNQTPAPVRATSSNAPDPMTMAVTIARAIDTNPTQADSILASYNLTAAAYEWRLHEIATDPGAAERYTLAMQ